MDWMHTDTPGDESPSCSFCEKQIGIDGDAFALRVGKLSSKGGPYEFSARLFEDKHDVKWFHKSCISMIFDLTSAENCMDPTDCAFCPDDLIGAEECYELELGNFNIRGRDTWWEETRDGTGGCVRVCSCSFCVENAVGEGDESEMRRRLGKKPQRGDGKKWIKDEEIPRIIRGESTIPPHLRRSGRRPPSARC